LGAGARHNRFWFCFNFLVGRLAYLQKRRCIFACIMNKEITVEQVIAALGHVNDPDLMKDLVTLNMIKDVVVEGNRVAFTVVLTTPACPMKDAIHDACVNAIKLLVSDQAELAITMTANVQQAAGQNVLPLVKNIIAVASGKGGVGKSTVSANLAVALALSGARVGLIDADIHGPSQHIMFGVKNEKPEIVLREGKNIMLPVEQYGVKLLSIGFLVDAVQAVVWRGPMASSAMRQFFTDCDWGALDYLIIDLPPGTGDIHLTLVNLLPVTGAVIVTTPQDIAVADAQKALSMFKMANINVPVLGVVENMSYFTPAELPDNKYYLFGKGGGERLAASENVALLAQLPLVQGVLDSGDAGKPAVLRRWLRRWHSVCQSYMRVNACSFLISGFIYRANV
jgi:ATP-binding protein involved in chromosome partitioning